MRRVETLIYCPVGDKSHPGADYEEACCLREKIFDENERSRNEPISIAITSLKKHPRVNWRYYLRYPGSAMGGHLIRVERLVPFDNKQQ